MPSPDGAFETDGSTAALRGQMFLCDADVSAVHASDAGVHILMSLQCLSLVQGARVVVVVGRGVGGQSPTSFKLTPLPPCF